MKAQAGKKNVQESLITFGTRLEQALARAGVNKSELARRIGAAYSTISRWGTRTVPSSASIQAIAQTLNISANWLMTGEGTMVVLDQKEETLKESFREGGVENRHVAATLAAGARGAYTNMDVPELVAHHAEVLQELITEPINDFRKSRAYELTLLIKEFALRARATTKGPRS